MDGIPTFVCILRHFLWTRTYSGVSQQAGLFAAVLTSFLVQSNQNLQDNPVEQSAYYQQQSVAILAHISQQIASIAPHVTIASTPAPPYPTFRPSGSDIRVNIYWVIGLVCSLSAALLATVVQQWVRSYMQVFQQYDHPLKRARFRQFFFEGSKGMRNLAKAVTRLIHVSLFLFFLGFADSMVTTNATVGVATIVPICLCGLFYLYTVTAHLKDLRSPYQTLLSRPIFLLIQMYKRLFGNLTLPLPTDIEAYQEELVMEEKERKNRDLRAIRWLVDNTAAKAEMEPLVLAIPGTFNTEWGREVWMNISDERWTDPDTLEPQTDRSPTGGSAPLTRHSPRFPEGTAGDTICRCVRYLFETCRNRSNFPNDDERRRRMRACVEAVASLVCYMDFELDWFGDFRKLVSEIGHIETINQSSTMTSDPSFIIHWTCLSLVSVQQILSSNRLRALAEYAVSGLARPQSEYGQPDEPGSRSAQKIDDCLKTTWEHVEELSQAFEPWTQKRTTEQVEEILRNHERQISELARIKAEADGMEDFDGRISLYQDAMDEATFGLARQLPGVSFDELRRTKSFRLSDTFITQGTTTASVIPQLIFPGQQTQVLARLGLKLREILDGHADSDELKEVLESLESVDQVPLSLRRPNGLMKRQLWRLQDLRDSGGLGFTVELFFLSLRRLLSIPSLHESNSIFYIGAFKLITSRWTGIKDSLGTQHILLNIICDLIIKGRGVFSDISYPEPAAILLIDMVGDMFRGYTGSDMHIRDAVQEIEDVGTSRCMDMRLRHRALEALPQFESDARRGSRTKLKLEVRIVE
jgi:hypothetical protein